MRFSIKSADVTVAVK